MKLMQRKIPNSRTARGYHVMKYPGGKIVGNRNKYINAKKMARNLAEKSKGKSYFVVTADIYEVYYQKKIVFIK